MPNTAMSGKPSQFIWIFGTMPQSLSCLPYPLPLLNGITLPGTTNTTISVLSPHERAMLANGVFPPSLLPLQQIDNMADIQVASPTLGRHFSERLAASSVRISPAQQHSQLNEQSPKQPQQQSSSSSSSSSLSLSKNSIHFKNSTPLTPPPPSPHGTGGNIPPQTPTIQAPHPSATTLSSHSTALPDPSTDPAIRPFFVRRNAHLHHICLRCLCRGGGCQCNWQGCLRCISLPGTSAHGTAESTEDSSAPSAATKPEHHGRFPSIVSRISRRYHHNTSSSTPSSNHPVSPAVQSPPPLTSNNCFFGTPGSDSIASNEMRCFCSRVIVTFDGDILSAINSHTPIPSFGQTQTTHFPLSPELPQAQPSHQHNQYPHSIHHNQLQPHMSSSPFPSPSMTTAERAAMDPTQFVIPPRYSLVHSEPVLADTISQHIKTLIPSPAGISLLTRNGLVYCWGNQLATISDLHQIPSLRSQTEAAQRAGQTDQYDAMETFSGGRGGSVSRHHSKSQMMHHHRPSALSSAPSVGIGQGLQLRPLSQTHPLLVSLSRIEQREEQLIANAEAFAASSIASENDDSDEPSSPRLSKHRSVAHKYRQQAAQRAIAQQQFAGNPNGLVPAPSPPNSTSLGLFKRLLIPEPVTSVQANKTLQIAAAASGNVYLWRLHEDPGLKSSKHVTVPSESLPFVSKLSDKSIAATTSTAATSADHTTALSKSTTPAAALAQEGLLHSPFADTSDISRQNKHSITSSSSVEGRRSTESGSISREQQFMQSPPRIANKSTSTTQGDSSSQLSSQIRLRSSLRGLSKDTILFSKLNQISSAVQSPMTSLLSQQYHFKTFPRLLAAIQGETIRSISLGRGYGMMVTFSNKVLTFGRPHHGRMAITNDPSEIGPILAYNHPKYISSILDKKIIAVTCSWTHTLFLTVDGEVYSVGTGGGHRLGGNCPFDVAQPIKVTFPDSTVKIEPSSNSGSADWTSNPSNHGGIESPENPSVSPQSAAAATAPRPPTIPIIAISAGYAHNLALDALGRVYVWGSNHYGQLGLGDLRSRSDPVRLRFNLQVPTFGTNQPSSSHLDHNDDIHISSITCGPYHSAAVSIDGVLYTWGSNRFHQLGLPLHSPLSCRHFLASDKRCAYCTRYQPDIINNQASPGTASPNHIRSLTISNKSQPSGHHNQSQRQQNQRNGSSNSAAATMTTASGAVGTPFVARNNNPSSHPTTGTGVTDNDHTNQNTGGAVTVANASELENLSSPGAQYTLTRDINNLALFPSCNILADVSQEQVLTPTPVPGLFGTNIQGVACHGTYTVCFSSQRFEENDNYFPLVTGDEDVDGTTIAESQQNDTTRALLEACHRQQQASSTVSRFPMSATHCSQVNMLDSDALEQLLTHRSTVSNSGSQNIVSFQDNSGGAAAHSVRVVTSSNGSTPPNLSASGSVATHNSSSRGENRSHRSDGEKINMFREEFYSSLSSNPGSTVSTSITTPSKRLAHLEQEDNKLMVLSTLHSQQTDEITTTTVPTVTENVATGYDSSVQQQQPQQQQQLIPDVRSSVSTVQRASYLTTTQTNKTTLVEHFVQTPLVSFKQDVASPPQQSQQQNQQQNQQQHAGSVSRSAKRSSVVSPTNQQQSQQQQSYQQQQISNWPKYARILENHSQKEVLQTTQSTAHLHLRHISYRPTGSPLCAMLLSAIADPNDPEIIGAKASLFQDLYKSPQIQTLLQRSKNSLNTTVYTSTTNNDTNTVSDTTRTQLVRSIEAQFEVVLSPNVHNYTHQQLQSLRVLLATSYANTALSQHLLPDISSSWFSSQPLSVFLSPFREGTFYRVFLRIISPRAFLSVIMISQLKKHLHHDNNNNSAALQSFMNVTGHSTGPKHLNHGLTTTTTTTNSDQSSSTQDQNNDSISSSDPSSSTPTSTGNHLQIASTSSSNGNLNDSTNSSLAQNYLASHLFPLLRQQNGGGGNGGNGSGKKDDLRLSSEFFSPIASVNNIVGIGGLGNTELQTITHIFQQKLQHDAKTKAKLQQERFLTQRAEIKAQEQHSKLIDQKRQFINQLEITWIERIIKPLKIVTKAMIVANEKKQQQQQQQQSSSSSSRIVTTSSSSSSSLLQSSDGLHNIDDDGNPIITTNHHNDEFNNNNNNGDSTTRANTTFRNVLLHLPYDTLVEVDIHSYNEQPLSQTLCQLHHIAKTLSNPDNITTQDIINLYNFTFPSSYIFHPTNKHIIQMQNIITQAQKLVLSHPIPSKLRRALWPLGIGNPEQITSSLYLALRSQVDIYRRYFHILQTARTQEHTQNASSSSSSLSSPSGNNTDVSSLSSTTTTQQTREEQEKQEQQLEVAREVMTPYLSQTFSQIDVDLVRTFPHLAFYQTGSTLKSQMSLLLTSLALHRPDIGYIQGVSFLVGLLLLYLDGSVAFGTCYNLLQQPFFVSIFSLASLPCNLRVMLYEYILWDTCGNHIYSRLQEHGLVSSPGSVNIFIEAESISKSVTFYNVQNNQPHDVVMATYDSILHKYDISCLPVCQSKDLYFIEWVLTLFTKSFDLDIASRIWDLYSFCGEESIYLSCIALLLCCKNEIMDLHQFDELLMFFRKDIKNCVTEEKFTAQYKTLRWRRRYQRKLDFIHMYDVIWYKHHLLKNVLISCQNNQKCDILLECAQIMPISALLREELPHATAYKHHICSGINPDPEWAAQYQQEIDRIQTQEKQQQQQQQQTNNHDGDDDNDNDNDDEKNNNLGYEEETHPSSTPAVVHHDDAHTPQMAYSPTISHDVPSIDTSPGYNSMGGISHHQFNPSMPSIRTAANHRFQKSGLGNHNHDIGFDRGDGGDDSGGDLIVPDMSMLLSNNAIIPTTGIVVPAAPSYGDTSSEMTAEISLVAQSVQSEVPPPSTANTTTTTITTHPADIVQAAYNFDDGRYFMSNAYHNDDVTSVQTKITPSEVPSEQPVSVIVQSHDDH